MCKITLWLSCGSFLDLIFQPGLRRDLGDAGSLAIVSVCNPGDLPRISGEESNEDFVHVTHPKRSGRALVWFAFVDLGDSAMVS